MIEPQPTTSRWRALTYKHAHTLLAQRRSPPAASPSPDSTTPAPFHTAPASIASSSSLAPPLLTLTEKNLRGVIAILALAGCTDARGLHRDPLRTRFGSALTRISARAERISSVVKTGVMSGLFEPIWIAPCRTVPASGRSSVVDGGAVNGTARTKGKEHEREREHEWVKDVERERRASRQDEDEDPGEAVAADFNWETMDNMYAGYGNERCRVLCTVELGLAFRRRLPHEEEREEESVDGDGMPLSRPTSSASKVVPEGAASKDAGRISRVPSVGTRTERTLLLKPKVLLESVVDVL